MTVVAARYYDGKSSEGRDVSIHAEAPASLHVIGDGIDRRYPLDQVRSSSRVGNTQRHLYFADGAQCETGDNDAIDEIFAGVRAELPNRLLHRWESRVGPAIAALLVTAGLLWLGIAYGIPALAKQIAFSMPASTEAKVGEEVLAGLDKVLLSPTRLSPKRQAELQMLFADMTSRIEGATGYRLELRASKTIGANALALPSGIVVVTDPLVELAENDSEIIAVLAHEIGHLQSRHDLRRLLQGSATVVLVVAVTGDLSAVSSLAMAVPALIVESKYSREFEREADDFAFDHLRSRRIATGAFTDILLRMARAHQDAPGSIPSFLSSHPSPEERAARFRAER